MRKLQASLELAEVVLEFKGRRLYYRDLKGEAASAGVKLQPVI